MQRTTRHEVSTKKDEVRNLSVEMKRELRLQSFPEHQKPQVIVKPKGEPQDIHKKINLSA